MAEVGGRGEGAVCSPPPRGRAGSLTSPGCLLPGQGPAETCYLTLTGRPVKFALLLFSMGFKYRLSLGRNVICAY